MQPYYQDDACTIYHGNARNILPMIEDRSVNMVMTDPPYGHNNNNNGDLIHKWEEALGHGKGSSPSNAARPIANDGAEANNLVRWAFAEFARVMVRPGACCCCCCGGGPDPQFARWSLWLDEVLDFKQMVVWDKGPMGMGWHYRRSYETVLVAEAKGGSRWYDTSDRIENIIRPGDYGIAKIIPSKDDHPTPKPVALMSHFIRLHTTTGDLVLDPFCGHGPTLRAAKDLGRRAIGIEIEEKYCEIAAKRCSQEVLPLT